MFGMGGMGGGWTSPKGSLECLEWWFVGLGVCILVPQTEPSVKSLHLPHHHHQLTRYSLPSHICGHPYPSPHASKRQPLPPPSWATCSTSGFCRERGRITTYSWCAPPEPSASFQLFREGVCLCSWLNCTSTIGGLLEK